MGQIMARWAIIDESNGSKITISGSDASTGVETGAAV
jgi:hypothetical protein